MSTIISRWLNALVAVLLLLGIAPALPNLTPTVAAAPPPDRPLVISEFRLRGPNPNSATNEFIEITNVGITAHIVAATTGTGYAVAASDGVVRFSIPNGTVIPAGGHYLGVNAVGYSLANYPAGSGTTATGDATYKADIPDNVGIALFSTDIVGDLILANRLDAVGSTDEANTLYKEGAGYPALTLIASIDHAFHRNECGNSATSSGEAQFFPCAAAGLLTDTDNNAADFVFVDTNGTFAGAGQRLGAPGPQNLSAPLSDCTSGPSGLTIGLLDPTAGAFAEPNFVRDFTIDPVNNSNSGTVDIRRRVTNTTGADITRLRFRFTDITTFPAASGIADLRPRTSPLIVVTTSGGLATVQGTTLEQPPSQPNGGGFNSSLGAGAITLGAPLANGASIDVHFLLGIQQTGDFKLSLQAEALPTAVCAESRLVGNTDSAFALTGPTGTPQATPRNTAFAAPLSVTVRPNVAVLFTAPASGASGTFAAPGSGNTAIVRTDINGVATAPEFTANGVGGTYNVTARVIDGGTALDVATATATFALTNIGPIANADNYLTNQGTPLVVAAPGVLANDTDDNAEPLSAAVATGPSNGTLTLNADGSFAYTSNGGFSGNDSFTYTATDGTTVSPPVTVTIAVAPVNNDAPVANGDSYAATKGAALVVAAPGVLANDTDAESNPLSAVLVAGPAHGTLVLNADGSFTYTPAANYSGPDSFTYKANDGTANSNVATVTVNVAPQNNPPVASNDAYTASPNTVLVVAAPSVLANDTDSDGTPLTAVLATGPQHGTLILNPNGAFTYTPTANYSGTDSFIYRANDGTANSNVATVTITVSAAPQVIVTTSAMGGGTISPSGASGYVPGSLVSYTATPAQGQVFLGWTLDGQPVGYASTLDFTVSGNRTLVATFAARPAFADVAPSGVVWDAITQLAARGVIKGYGDGNYGPTDTVVRAQVAALIVRAFGWDTDNPSGPMPFADLGGVDPELQRAIAILAERGSIAGYGDGTFGPTDEVRHAQVISFIARSMVQAGYWQAVTADDPSLYPDVPLSSGHRLDLLTFVQYAGAIPNHPSGQDWADWVTPASRGWTAQVLWQALNSYFGIDRVP